MDERDTRIRLSVILRSAAPLIIERIVAEAARSSGAGSDDVRAYEALMRQLAPAILDAVAAGDDVRARTFGALATVDVDGMNRVPPVARVGLLEIGLRLARTEIEIASRGRPDGDGVVSELDVLAGQLRSALVALGAIGDVR